MNTPHNQEIKKHMEIFSERYSQQALDNILKSSGFASTVNFDALEHPDSENI